MQEVLYLTSPGIVYFCFLLPEREIYFLGLVVKTNLNSNPCTILGDGFPNCYKVCHSQTVNKSDYNVFNQFNTLTCTTQASHILQQVCKQAVNKLCSHCLSTSLEQAVNNLYQPCRYYQNCCEVVPCNKSNTVMI